MIFSGLYFPSEYYVQRHLLAIVENKSGLKLSDRYFITTAEDNFYGTVQDDYFDAGVGNDYVRAFDGNDTLLGGDNDDFIVGDKGNDTISGGNGNDSLLGTTPFSPMDSDFVSGGRPNPPVLGKGQIDTLTGGAGKDNFWLGESLSGKYYSSYGYYDDDNAATVGNNDYALITDFNLQEDKITLIGQPTDYLLKATSGSLPAGTGIYINKPGSEPDELIGIVKDISPTKLNLSNSYFFYTNPEPISVPS